MAHGHFEGKDERDPSIRGLFTLESLLSSDWYGARLDAQRDGDLALWRRHVSYLEAALAGPRRIDAALRPMLDARLDRARARLEFVASDGYRTSLTGTIGAQPSTSP
jgi:hypothetical protein